jgi:hypothetical protein
MAECINRQCGRVQGQSYMDLGRPEVNRTCPLASLSGAVIRADATRLELVAGSNARLLLRGLPCRPLRTRRRTTACSSTSETWPPSTRAASTKSSTSARLCFVPVLPRLRVAVARFAASISL